METCKYHSYTPIAEKNHIHTANVKKVVEMKNNARPQFLVITDSTATEGKLIRDVPIVVDAKVYCEIPRRENKLA